jgi:hypothetical protein
MAARSPLLETAFRATRYELVTPLFPTTVRIDEPSANLAALQRALGVAQSGVVSAWNPRGERRPHHENAAAHARLCACAAAFGLQSWPAWHRAPDAQWDEQGLFIAGIDRVALLALGREFGQHAVLHAGADGRPRLLWCED